mmetsp:Transcript_73641/g.193197  ORF Transcript_73641/g.193197 Transcript_73641/m.193197 type:complete len:527 (-) Transcript_73641:21-1601(-)
MAARSILVPRSGGPPDPDGYHEHSASSNPAGFESPGDESSDESTIGTLNGAKTITHKESRFGKFLIPTVFVVFILVRALDRIFLYRIQKSMASYTTTVMSIYWPPMVQVMCFFVCLGHLAKKKYVDGDKSISMAWFSPWNPNASSQGIVPMIWVAQFSFWDQLNAIISAPPGPFIPLVLQTPLNNTVVLFTAFISYFYLHTRFKMVHYAGILLILISCLCGVLVELQGPDPSICKGLHLAQKAMDNPYMPSTLVSDETRWAVGNATDNCIIGLPPYKDANGNVTYIPFSILALMYFLFILAVVPASFGNCYKQKKLKQVNLDVMWSFFWAGMWQVVWGLVMYPAVWIHWPSPGSSDDSQASPSTMGRDIHDSWLCFTGVNPNASITTCDGDPAWVWFIVYLLFNVFYNVFFNWLIKKLSGTWASIGSILCGNLCGILSQYAIFAGNSAELMNLEQWTALVLSSVAMWVYNVDDEVDVHGDSVWGQKEKGDHRYDVHGVLGVHPDEEEYAEDDMMGRTSTARSHGLF